MNKNETIKKNKDFKKIYAKGKYFASANVVTYAARNRLNKTRIGITTSKKTGNAVQRNRSRRIIRAAYFNLKPFVKRGFDIVFVSRQNTSKVKTGDVLNDIKYHFKRLNLLDVSKEFRGEQN